MHGRQALMPHAGRTTLNQSGSRPGQTGDKSVRNTSELGTVPAADMPSEGETFRQESYILGIISLSQRHIPPSIGGENSLTEKSE
ncbi:hypothetical protein BDZ89DRAFT_1078443 [Hymenopellis radicata]|nr:hypothetical protein BDZ89DRAFT_1078443 [Hymenopellis radicata]